MGPTDGRMSPHTRRLLFVFGTRPEAIKTAPVIAACRKDSRLGPGATRVCVTAQHRQILDPFLDEFGIVPDVDLDVMREDQTPTEVAARVLRDLDPVLDRERPDVVVVQGDTTSAMAAALAAFHRHIPVAHIEAGLRTGDPFSPWPEEMNRRVIGRLASLHFAPTEGARRNLLREGVSRDRVVLTGNPGMDALLCVKRRLGRGGTPALFAGAGPLPATFVLVTLHRRENLGQGIEGVGLALLALLERFPDLVVVWPVHPNPAVRRTLNHLLSPALHGERLRLLPPLAYSDFIALLARCHLVISDSGGVQEEAPALGRPVLCARDRTERPEGVRAGAVRLVGTDRARIVEAAVELLSDGSAYRRMARERLLYGDGQAATRIARALREHDFAP